MIYFLSLLLAFLIGFILYKFKQEIAHRKQIEQQLKTTQTLYDQINETIIDVIWETDKDYVFTYISPSVEPILGYKPQELIGKHVFFIFTQSGVDVSMKRMEQRKKDAAKGIFSAYSILDVEHKAKDGRIVWGEVVSKVNLDENNNITGHHGISRDITKRVEMEKEQELLFQELDHRVKNNLQIISSIVFLHSSQEDTTKSLEDIHNTISAISLAHDKLHHNKSHSTLEIKNYISDLLDNLLSSSILKIEKEIHSKELYLNSQLSITLGIIINEFINNSIKYAFEGVSTPKITVTIKEQKEYISIIASDNGIGFKEPLQHSGLGMQIIKVLAKNKFKHDVEFYNNHGTSMKLRINKVT